MKRSLAAVPRPVNVGERDPFEPEAKPGMFVVTMRRPDGAVSYMQLPNENYERVQALVAGEFGDRSILAIGPKS